MNNNTILQRGKSTGKFNKKANIRLQNYLTYTNIDIAQWEQCARTIIGKILLWVTFNKFIQMCCVIMLEITLSLCWRNKYITLEGT